MPSLIPSFVAALTLAASQAAAAPLDVYQEAYAAPVRRPAATRVVHDGVPYTEAFAPSPAGAVPARPALAATAVPYTEAFANTTPVANASFGSAARTEPPATACACSCHRHG